MNFVKLMRFVQNSRKSEGRPQSIVTAQIAEAEAQVDREVALALTPRQTVLPFDLQSAEEIVSIYYTRIGAEP